MASIKDFMLPIKAVSFRSIVNKIICIECRTLLEEMFGTELDKSINCMIGYCYIDHERGMSFQPCLTAIVSGDEMQLKDLPDYSIMYVIRISEEHIRNSYVTGEKRMETYSVSPDNMWFAVSTLIEDMSMFDEFIRRFDSYLPTADVAELRKDKSLDEFRNEYYPDDVLVALYRKDKPIEKVWVRCEFVTDRCMFGILLNEPFGELDYHENETIGFEFYGENEDRVLMANGLKAEIVKD